MKPWIILGFLLLSLPLALAQEDVRVSFQDLETGNAVEELIAHMNLEADDIKIDRSLFFKKGILLPENRTFQGSLELDDADTPAIDYYFAGSIDTKESEQKIVLTPVAHIEGTVFDTLQNLVDNAEVSISCQRPLEKEFSKVTDKYGGFATTVPTGKCTISVTSAGKIGRETVELTRGESKEITIILDQRVRSNNVYWYILVILIILAIVYRKKFTKKETKEEPVEKVVKKARKKVVSKKNNRLDDILKTLNAREASLVKLVAQEKKKILSSQLRHQLKIPKTSFNRILETLEKKNILEVERLGKTKKIQLSEWLRK